MRNAVLATICHIFSLFCQTTLLEEMVLFRTRNGSIPRFIQYMELQNGSI